MEASSTNFFDNPYHRKLRLHLRIGGLWPYSQEYLSHCLKIVPIVVGSAFFFMQIIYVVEMKFDTSVVIESIPILMLTIAVSIKFTGYLIQMKKAKVLLEHVRSDWMYNYCKEELDILHKYTRTGKFITDMYTYILEAAIVFFTVVHCVPDFLDEVMPRNESRTREFLFQAEYFLDRDKYFYVILAYITASMQLSFFVVTGMDFMYTFSTLHACAMSKIVGYKLEHIFDGDAMPLSSPNNEKMYLANLANCVRCHTRLLRFVDAINSCVSHIYAIQCAFAIISLSVSYYCLCMSLVNAFDIRNVLVRFLHLVPFVVALFVCAVPPQILANCSADIAYHAYSSNWTIAGAKLRRMIAIIIMRSSEPMKLYLGNYIVISLETYATVMQMAMSYFMVLYQTRIN